jgi:tetratricopeptide (TPR) repeat protein
MSAATHRRRPRRRVGGGTPTQTRGVTLWPWILGLTFVVAAAYANSLRGPFFVDDLATISDNASVHDWSHLHDLIASPEETPVTSRPLVALSFVLNYTLGQEHVGGYHFLNIAVHLAVALVLFAVVRQLLGVERVQERIGPRAVPIAFAVAVVWAVHPLNTEAVDYLTQRTESLMAFFYLATIYASVRVMCQPGSLWTAGAVACCAAGLACKESMVTAPVAVLLIDRVFVSDSVAAALRRRWRLYVGLAMTWLLLAALVALPSGARSAGFTSIERTWTYLLNQTVMILRYVRLTLWPTSLVVNYGWPLSLRLKDVWPQALFVLGLFVATLWALWKRPVAGFVGAWFFLTLAPTSSVMPIATEVGAERRMYVPSMALFAGGVIAIVLLADRVAVHHRLRRWTLILGWTALTALVVVLFVGTVRRNREYQSPLRLAQTAVERWPSSVGEHVLGMEWLFAGNTREARRHFERAVPGAPRAYYSLATVEFDDRQWDAAVRDFLTFLAVEPRLYEAISARLYLAQALEHTGQWQAAINQCRLVLTMHPTRENALDAQLFFAEGLRGQQRYEAAREEYEAYTRSRPDDVRGANGLGISLVGLNRVAEAAPWFRRAADLAPMDDAVMRNAAMALLEIGRVDDAAPYAERAARLRPDNAASHDLWGQVLFEQHKIQAALEQFQVALGLDPAAPDVRAHLDEVRKRTPR